MTLQVQLVLRMLAGDPGRERYGLEIVESTGLPPGTIYPIMARLEASGWVTSRWETIDHHAEGRPRRRYYRLSPDGLIEAGAALATVDSRRRGARSGAVGPAVPGGAVSRIGVAGAVSRAVFGGRGPGVVPGGAR
jgi:hypothetical protein